MAILLNIVRPKSCSVILPCVYLMGRDVSLNSTVREISPAGRHGMYSCASQVDLRFL